MKIYNNYTSQEKSDYNLRLYIIDLCNKLDVVYNDQILNTVVGVINVIKKTSGSKRLKIKDSIILITLAHITGKEVLDMSKLLEIENKYIYNSKKFFASIPELKEFIKTKTSFEYIESIFNKNKNKMLLNINQQNPLGDTKKLIDYCQKRNILSESSPATIGASCLYFVIDNCKDYDEFQIDILGFSKIFDVSYTTINKSVIKIKQELNTE